MTQFENATWRRGLQRDGSTTGLAHYAYLQRCKPLLGLELVKEVGRFALSALPAHLVPAHHLVLAHHQLSQAYHHHHQEQQRQHSTHLGRTSNREPFKI